MSLLPKEHGAYGQMAFPLATAVAIAGMSAPSLLIVVAVIAGFLAHEPLLVIAGMRGQRARREEFGAAVPWLAALGVTSIVAGATAIVVMPLEARWFVIVPLAPAAGVFLAIAAGREKSWLAEVGVALAFSLAAIPTALAANVGLEIAAAIGVTFAVHFVLATLSVRVVILKVRSGGNVRALAATRSAVFVLAGAAVAVVIAACARGALPWATLVALVPGITAAVWLAGAPPPAARLRRVGWALMATSLATAMILIVGLRPLTGHRAVQSSNREQPACRRRQPPRALTLHAGHRQGRHMPVRVVMMTDHANPGDVERRPRSPHVNMSSFHPLTTMAEWV